MRGQSFYDWCIENNRENLLSEWEYNKNYPLTPHNCARGTSKKVWWKCKKGHEWQASVGYRAKFARPCPICNGTHTLVTGVNDLMTVNPKLANEWDYDLNGELTPSMILPRSMKKVWWICEKGHRYQSTVDNRTKGSGCPICSKERKTSMPEKAVYFYVLKYFKDAIDNYKAVWLGKSEIDIYVPSLRLAIEYDGERWHQDVEKDKKKDSKETTAQKSETTTAAQQTTTVGQEESATKGTEQEITTAKTEKTSTAASGEVSDNSTKTGDSSHVMVYVIVLAACVIICVGVIVFSAKKKK